MSTGTRPPRRDERGAGTVLVIGVVLMLAALALVGVMVSGYSTAQHATSGAADLVALSAAAAYRDGGDACAAAAAIATDNQVEVTGCTVAGDAIDYAVAVTVRRQLSGPVGWPITVSAGAVAGHLAAS